MDGLTQWMADTGWGVAVVGAGIALFMAFVIWCVVAWLDRY